MKWLILGAIFLGVPYYLLNNFVMPELAQMQTFYSNIDQIAQQAVNSQPK